MAGRHAAPKRGGNNETRKNRNGRTKPKRIGLIITPLILAGLIAIGWFTPANLIPLPKTVSQCVVQSGGTLRIHTDCGTYYYRGHADVDRYASYTIEHTGPFAWTITPAAGEQAVTGL
ncbi:hypothetical protein [Bifidobacterium sp. SO1]|uniref:hypothetical protein n=1 Tax=Bifidobacterium sp. SO1 TaxID=2809029 RepID=UPI001BDCFF2D|nr:hypothetical protein [Bifidobacterium sp. SO1]MBT1161731.1 hypothetical protein [Bifidobacterium sp. SO1]